MVSSETQKLYAKINMDDAISGQSVVRVANNCNELFLVASSVPEHFSGTQTYGYQVKIEIDSPTYQ